MEEMVEYEFDDDQSSFDGYSDSWEEDSEGNPYESDDEYDESDSEMVHEGNYWSHYRNRHYGDEE